MKIMLDTNMCIYSLKAGGNEIAKRIKQHKVGNIGISSITLGELAFGVEKSVKKEQNLHALNLMLQSLVIWPFGDSAAFEFGRLRAYLKTQGTPIGPYDIQIAAHAIALNATLVTNNVKEFQRVPGLKIENWI